MKNLIWLASYPKSGNTWVRVFFTNLLKSSEQPAHINKLMPTLWANDNSIIERYANLEPSELSQDEMQEIRQKVFVEYSKSLNKKSFVKTHHINALKNNEAEFINKEITHGVIYIVRNPLDVAVSLSFHENKPLDEVIYFMNNKNAMMGKNEKKYYKMGAEYISSWSNNYSSYAGSTIRTLIIKYEDLLEEPLHNFKRMVDFSGYEFSEKEISLAIKNSQFKNLKDQESKRPFSGGSNQSTTFFRQGENGSWKNVLNSKQIDLIVRANKRTMLNLGYLT